MGVLLSAHYEFRHGCDTVILGRKMDRLTVSAQTLRQATGRRCLPVQMDVRQVRWLAVSDSNSVTEAIRRSSRKSENQTPFTQTYVQRCTCLHTCTLPLSNKHTYL